jgi:hypothetical protein
MNTTAARAAQAAERAEAEAKWIRQAADDLGIQHAPNMVQGILLEHLYQGYEHSSSLSPTTVSRLLALEKIRQAAKGR